jgi:AraC-like DNA-binding protein
MELVRFESQDASSVEETWKTVLPSVQIDRLESRNFQFAWESFSHEGFALTTYEIAAEVTTVVDQPDVLMVAQINGTAVSATAGREDFDTSRPWLSPGRIDVGWRSNTATRVVTIDRDEAEQVARQLSGNSGLRLRWLGSAPISAERYRYWDGVMRHARATLNGAGGVANALVQQQTIRLVVEATLLTFPTTLLDSMDGSQSSLPCSASVRRAQQFAEDNAQLPVSVDDLARAARMSTRGLQAAFRASTGMTPMAYLRMVRLEAARKDLQAADPTRGDTVQMIAARWGFSHPARFSNYYLTAYGEHPSATLQR